MKTRVLPQDFGAANDLKYWSSSGSYNYSVANRHLYDKFVAEMSARYYDGMSKRNTNATSPSFVGGEVFDSSKNPQPLFNTCFHTIDKVVNYAYGYVHPAWNIWPGWTSGYYAPYLRSSGAYTGVSKYKADTNFEAWDATSRRAWWSMQPRFEGEVSMLNFLFELKDFRDIAKFAIKVDWASISKTLLTFSKRLSKYRKELMLQPHSVISLSLKSAKALSLLAAQLHLTNEFAIKPLISDLSHIFVQSNQIIEDVQNEFKSKGLEKNTRHFSETSEFKRAITPGRYNAMFFGSGELIKSLFTATLEFKYNYILRLETELFMKYWGLNFTPEVIWEAIPFSFLVDYFCKIGDAIHNVSLDKNCTVFTQQYCESILTTGQEGTFWRGLSNSHAIVDGLPAGPDALIAGRSYSSYVRRVVAPNRGLPTPKFKLPSGKQGLNMVALARCFIK